VLWQKAAIENGQLKIVESKEVDQRSLTSDCWPIQIEGIKACTECEFLGTKDCGGKRIRKQILKGSNK
jgi:hypothetical protein